VRSGMLIYPFAEARAVLEGYIDIAASAPEELSAQLIFICGADGTPLIMIVPTWCGEQAAGEAAIAPLQKLGTLVVDTIGVVPYGTLLRMFDAHFVSGQRVIMETNWLPALDRDNIGIFIEAMVAAVSPGCAIITHHFRGAASRVPLDATAFGLRRDHVLVEILATFADRSDRSDEERHARWARTTRDTFAARALPGGYPNLLASDQLDRATRAFGRNAGRLARAKRHYDPDNLFRSAIPLPAAE
jgi:berberine-like enzyme